MKRKFMNRLKILFLFIIIPTTIIISRQKDSKKDPKKLSVNAMRISESILIDGKLDEKVWKNSALVTNFTQRDPNEGKPATQKTVVRICYDDDAIYMVQECLIAHLTLL